MATLTQTAYFSRKIIKYGSLVLAALIGFRAIYVTVKRFIPPKAKPLPAPNTAFGKLPAIIFSEQRSLPDLNYKLETISGTLPKLSTQAKVFFLPRPSSNLLAWDKTKQWAKNLGFTNDPQETSQFDYFFTNNSSPKTTLTVNVLTRNFSFTYDWQNDLSNNLLQTLTESQAIAQATTFLQNFQSLDETIDITLTKVTFLKNEGESLIETTASEANLARVNFFRKNIDNIKVLPPLPKEANISIIVSSLNNNYQGVISAKYIHNSISFERYATYPLKDINQAWSLLINQKTYVVNLGNNSEGSIAITNAYLAYYDSDKTQDFLQPVIVFEGSRDFLAYIPAISDSLILEQESAR